MAQESGIPVNKSKWANGTIVALKSHFYTAEMFTGFIVYSGEPRLISPLMIITETIPEKKSYHPTTGELLNDNNDESYQCKCTWFSTKNFQFEETIISSRLLQVIKPSDGLVEYKFGDLVELKSSQIELGKKKSSLKSRDNLFETTVTSELSFVSPVMQVISIVKNDIKEPLRDANTGKAKRYISTLLAKCKYYNNASEKMSEVLISTEALSKIPTPPDHNQLKNIKDAIENKYHLVYIRKGNRSRKLLIDPKRITYRSGQYYVSGYDLFSSKTEEFDLLKYNFDVLDKLESDFLPNFGGEDSKFKAQLITPTNVQKLIKENTEKLLLITYTDFNNIETKRIIGEPKLLTDTTLINATDPKAEKNHYLKAFCHLRKAERHFNLNGIKTIKVLNI